MLNHAWLRTIRVSLTASLLALAIAFGQQADGERKVINKVMPGYPELARTMKLEGSVKLQVTVAPNGTPKFTEVIGGSPVLVKAAQDAIYRWRWSPGSRETKETVEMRFHSN